MIIRTSLKTKNKKKKNNRLVKPDQKEPPKKPMKDDVSKSNEWVYKNETGIKSEIFQKRFSFQRPSDMLKAVYKTNDKKKDNKLVNVIKSGYNDLKNKTKSMGKEEKEIEKPNEIIDAVENVIEFNKQNQLGQGLKILTPD